MSAAPDLDLTDWAMTDFEVLDEALTRMAEVAQGFLNQPRVDEEPQSPVGAVLTQMMEGFDRQSDTLRAHVRSLVGPIDNGRRGRLVLRWAAEEGATLADLAKLAAYLAG